MTTIKKTVIYGWATNHDYVGVVLEKASPIGEVLPSDDIPRTYEVRVRDLEKLGWYDIPKEIMDEMDGDPQVLILFTQD